MYKDWYAQQYHQYDDTFSSEWEVFGMKSKSQPASEGYLGPLEKVSADQILGWLEDISIPTGSQKSHARFCMIFTRHQRHQDGEINPAYLAFDKETFMKIIHAMKLPLAYQFMRVNAGASGNFAKYSTFDDHGSISNLGLVIRVPHSPRANAKAVWSLAVSWDASTCSTSSLFESLSDEDMQAVEAYSSAKAHRKQKQHPLFLPVMLLRLLNSFYVEHRRTLEHWLYQEESGVGITRGIAENTDAWKWGYERQRDATMRFHKLNTGLVYLERRLDFASRLGAFILQCLTYCQEEDLFPPGQKDSLTRVSKELKEHVTNDANFVGCQLHQVSCLQKRAQALVSVMYSVVSQNDSRTNVGIAKAAKLDSSSMATIAVLGIIFLPAMLVASMFSMSMFDFSTPSSSALSGETRSESGMVASTFWIFWAVTIPLTLTVLAVWRIWMRRVQSSAGRSEAQMEEAIACQPVLHRRGPFY